MNMWVMWVDTLSANDYHQMGKLNVHTPLHCNMGGFVKLQKNCKRSRGWDGVEHLQF